MSTTCFFCQNLLSDYLEGILPTSRHEEIRAHLEKCTVCGGVHQDLKKTVKLLHALPTRSVPHELALQMVDAAQSTRNLFQASRASRFVLVALAVGGALWSWVMVFPESVPLLSRWSESEYEAQFTPYHPLQQGAVEILEEQSAWLHSRETMMGSLWEEGGLSPDEFERTFQYKTSPGSGSNDES